MQDAKDYSRCQFSEGKFWLTLLCKLTGSCICNKPLSTLQTGKLFSSSNATKMSPLLFRMWCRMKLQFHTVRFVSFPPTGKRPTASLLTTLHPTEATQTCSLNTTFPNIGLFSQTEPAFHSGKSWRGGARNLSEGMLCFPLLTSINPYFKEEQDDAPQTSTG